MTRRDPTAAEVLGEQITPQGWRANPVPAPRDERVRRSLQDFELRFPVARDHRQMLQLLGSQFTYAAPCLVNNARECEVTLVRFSGAVESAFGFTRELLFLYSPYPDLQHRTFVAARASLRHLPRDVTPDLVVVWSKDPRARVKLDDWSGTEFTAIPLPADGLDDPLELLRILREYVFTRDLYYETTPVSGDQFFGRRPLLQSLRTDLRSRRVVGVFGLRKAGKTSVLEELGKTMESEDTVYLLRDLESLPSPPDDPIPDLIADLRQDVVSRMEEAGLSARALNALSPAPSVAEFRRALQDALRELAVTGIQLVVALDEIEYLVPSDRIDVREGDMPSVAQFLGALRSLVQENENFTFLISGLTSAMIESGRLYGRPNPLFSWAKAYFLSPFSQSEADDLAIAVGQRMGVRLDAGALDALYEATGGHAFLYRHLASAVVGELPIDVMSRTMLRSDVLRSLTSWQREIAGNIEEMVNHVRRYYPDEAFLLQTLQEDPDEFEKLARDMPTELSHLLRLGLVEESQHEFALTPVLQLL